MHKNTHSYCEGCGQPVVEGTGDWERNESWTASTGASVPALVPGTSWTRRQPARNADFASDVGVPLAQASVTAIVGGIAGGLLGGDVTAGLVGAGVTFGLTWLFLLQAHHKLLYTVERVSGQDLDGDGTVGSPEERDTLRVELVENTRTGGNIRFLDLPVGTEKLQEVARAVLVAKARFSRDGLSSVLSQSQYRKLASAMVDAGLLVDLPGNRRELSASGRSLLRGLLE